MEKIKLEPVPIDQCSLVKVAELFSDKWILLIMRHIFYGRNQFDQFVDELSVSRSVLSVRLEKLTNYAVLQKVPYKEQGQRTRYRYELTAQGLQLFPAIIALMQWGDQHLSDAPQAPLQLFHKECGASLQVSFVCGEGHQIKDYREIEAKSFAK